MSAPIRLLGENSTPIWGMTNAERCRRMAEKDGKPLAPGHELVFNLAYVFDPMLPKGVTPYDEYSRNWYYGDMGVGPISREEYMKQYCKVAPGYEEYQQLYKKYSE